MIRSICEFQRRTSLITELRACGITKNLHKGKLIHEGAIQNGDDSSAHVASTLINMYAKCGSMKDARWVFEKMKQPDVVAWTALILGYADNGEGEIALNLFSEMTSCHACAPDVRTYLAVLRACTDLVERDYCDGKELVQTACRERGRGVHLLASRNGCFSNLHFQSTLVDLYAKCGSMKDACGVFEQMAYRDVISWNALIFGSADNGDADLALSLFSKMRTDGVEPNLRSLVAVLKACTDLVAKENGKAVHLLGLINGCDSDIFVTSTLIDMYAKCGSMRDALWVFDHMKNSNVVCWNNLILGYADNGDGFISLGMFSRMRREGCTPDATTFVAALKACSGLVNGEGILENGRQLHLLALRHECETDIYVKGSLVDMYGKCGIMEEARRVFDNTKSPSVVCWNALILGYADNGEARSSLEAFSRMKNDRSLPNVLTFAAVLKACAILGEVEFGRQVHREIMGSGLDPDAILVTSLVDFYAKCGSLDTAEQIFGTHAAGVSTWNALMAAYGRHGNTEGVFDLFDEMQNSTSVQPDGITFLCVLASCSHAGLLEKGKKYFDSMATSFGICHDIEHYTCMLDILGRANKLEDAMVLLRCMPFSTNSLIWMTVLGACEKWKNLELGKLAFESILSIGAKDPAAYVLMANIKSSTSNTVSLNRCPNSPIYSTGRRAPVETPSSRNHFG